MSQSCAFLILRAVLATPLLILSPPAAIMDPQEWYATMPKVTRFLFTGALVTTLAGNFGLVSPYTLLLNFSAIYNKFEVRGCCCSSHCTALIRHHCQQIWRLLTGVFFFGKLGFPFLINLYFLYNYSSQLEKGARLLAVQGVAQPSPWLPKLDAVMCCPQGCLIAARPTTCL